jgi:hypothetical protein
MKKISQEDFIQRSNIANNNFYDYSASIFTGTKNKVSIVCPIHGIFTQIAQNHMRGDRCPSCTRNKKLDTPIFVERAQGIHGNVYDYSLVEYKNNSTKVKLICNIHHSIFEQTPNKHLEGHGCPQCGPAKMAEAQKLSWQDFADRASLIHNNKYDYSLIDYQTIKQYVIIMCPTHGEFHQTPDNHLAGHGCSKCTSSISKMETKWLDSLNIKERNKTIHIAGKIFKVDGFDLASNTIYEFYGDYWHGNPDIYNSSDYNQMNKKTFGDLYNHTMRRQETLQKAGYNIVYIWENNFQG